MQALELKPDDALFENRVELWVAPLFEGEFPILGTAGYLDFKMGAGITRALNQGQISGALGECTLFAHERAGRIYRVLLLGAGPLQKDSKRKLEDPKVFKKAREELDRLKIRTVGISLRDFPTLSHEKLTEEFGQQVELWIAA